MAKYISLAANPVYILCFASFYATTSQLIKYFSKKKNRKDLTGDLEDILIRLRRLFEEAEKISAPHETTFKELEKYLTSIDNAIYNLSGEGAINVNVMTQIMLEDTNTVQVCFLDLKNKANTIVQVLRKPLRNLDSGYVIN
ncbi:hypothetical protein BDF21DRAFT_408654 [Thamnidium elegans]|nr:hypothetical protein BDF21DRAFT_408654 [Thamnidium elegans]